MMTAARSRAFPNFAMPSGSGDKSQQPMGSGFPVSNLYPNKSIWNSAYAAHPRDRSIGPQDSEDNPTGSSALNANSEVDVWGSGPWNPENPSRSVTNSPGLARDGGITNGSAFYDHHQHNHHAAIGMKKGGYGVNSFQDESDGYATAFASQKRNAQDAAYMDSIAAFAPSRDASLPPSRHSQGSPAAYAEIYQNGHTPSNSIHSQRQMPNHSIPFSTQAANQRAFNLNKQIDEDISLRIARQLVLDGSANGPSFNPASQPFQFNPGSQPWMGESGASRYGNGLDFNADPMMAHFSAIKRPTDIISPTPGYRFENGGSQRAFAPAPEVWMARPSSRDPRTIDHDRRPSNHQFIPNYAQYYTYANLAPQYSPSFADPYAQNFRHPMQPSYGLPPIHTGYPLGSPLSLARPSTRDQDPGKGMRSLLLDEFRLNNKSSKRYELRDIYDYVVEFSGDQHGSRFIQQKLETANSDEKEQVFREIEPNAVQLMKDVFGNYVVQKFFEHGSQLQKKILAEKMKGRVVDLSIQVYACRVVQKALEHVLVEQQAELTKELEPEILKVTKDQNGNHVVQKVIELVPRQYIDFIMGSVRGQVPQLASHTYGCRVIQRMLEYGTETDKAEIMNELHASCQILITDQYGNYVAQHVIQKGKQEDRERIIRLVMSQLLTLSKHKFASNVVEKCIEYGTPEQRNTIREQLTTAWSDGNNPLQQMMRDQYGNYVIQKMLGQLKGTERETLVEDIKPQFFALKRNGASRQLQALEKLLGIGGTAKNDHASAHSDTNSVPDVPILTHETNSPQSSSPPSTRVSAVGFPSDDSKDRERGNVADGITLQVRDGEA